MKFWLSRFIITFALASASPANAADDGKTSTAAKPDGLALDAEARARIGLKTQPLITTNLSAEVTAYGSVLDPSPLALLDAELSGAAAAFTIARAQEEREQTLFEQKQIVARASLETAQLQVQATETRHETALRRLATEWGEPFTQLDSINRHVLIKKLLRREMILLRVELPAGETLTTNPPTARIVTIGGDRDRTAAWFCEAPTVDARTQGRAFLFQASGPDTALRPGAALTAFLPQGGSATTGTLVPATAVVRHLGHAWIYLAEADDRFTRHAVTLDRFTASGWFTASPLPTGAAVVTTGAQLLLSEELKAQLAGD